MFRSINKLWQDLQNRTFRGARSTKTCKAVINATLKAHNWKWFCLNSVLGGQFWMNVKAQCGDGAINIPHLVEFQEVTDRTECFKQSKCCQIETVGHIRRNTWEEIWHDSPNTNYVGDPWNVWRFFYLLFVFFHLADANHRFLRSKN